MKNAWIAMAVVLIVGLVIYGISKTEKVQKTFGLLSKLELALDIAERIEKQTTTNTFVIDLLLDQLCESDRKVDSLTELVSGYASIIESINSQISELPTYVIPEISYTDPADYEECLQELTNSRLVSEQLTEIVNIQRDHIELLEGKNLNQQLIIETQQQTITILRTDNMALRDAYDDMIRDANRRKWVGYFVGALGIVMALL